VSDLFLRTCRGEPTERRPVWLMRQAGRYLPEYRAIREKVDFLTLCKTPELAAEVTLQPVGRLGVDAAIQFADILLPLEAMGAKLVFTSGDGPSFPHPVRTREDVRALDRPDVRDRLSYVFEAIRIARRELGGSVPLIGFGGTPWTLAAYLVEGGPSRTFSHLLGWSYADPSGLALLLGRLAETSAAYVAAQVAAGAQAIQLFDTWGGLLSAERWLEFALPPLRTVIAGIGRRVPILYYIHDGAHLLPVLGELPVDVIAVDWRQPLTAVRQHLGARPLQGNLDPAALLSPIAEIERQTATLLAQGRGGSHIVNLGHGILPFTPLDHARAFVAAVQAAPLDREPFAAPCTPSSSAPA
jgi:uroporphyrinogen decarboxylase